MVPDYLFRNKNLFVKIVLAMNVLVIKLITFEY